MPDIGINQPVTVAAAFFNDSGPATGNTVLVTVTSRRTGTVIVNGATSNETPTGSGYYTYTIPASLLTQSDRLQVVFQSVAAGLYNESFVRVGDLQDWMLTRREVRQGIARRLDGWQAALEFDASGGTTLSATIPALNFGGDGEYNGMWARFSDGANRGQDRRVLDYDPDTTTIAFAPALPQAVVNLDRVELYRVPAWEFDRVIRRAFADADSLAVVPFEERVLSTDGVTLNFDLPSDVRTISAVGLNNVSGFMGWLPPNQWSLGPGNKLTITTQLTYNREQDPLRFGPQTSYQPLASGYDIYIRGRAAGAAPLYDDSYCDLPPGYLEASGHYQMALTRPEMSSVWAFLQREKDVELMKATSILETNSRYTS